MRLPYGHDVLGGQGNLKTQKLVQTLVQKSRETAIENRSRICLYWLLADCLSPLSGASPPREEKTDTVSRRASDQGSYAKPLYCTVVLIPRQALSSHPGLM